MNANWIAMEHYRLHVVEDWAEGPRKDAALTAIRSALDGLERSLPDLAFECCVCGAPVALEAPAGALPRAA